MTKEKNGGPPDINMADLINAIFPRSIAGSVKDPLADPPPTPATVSAPPVEEVAGQISAPTSSDMKEMETLAGQAAALQDEIDAAIGDKQRRLKALKGDLLEKMMSRGLRFIAIPGRGPVEVTTRNEKQKTMKAIIEAAGSKAEGMKIWNALPTDEKHSISIPRASTGEEEPPY